MATIKSYTDISQSKTLSKILPLESADMYYSDVPVREWVDRTDTSKGTHVVFKSQIFAIENLPNHKIGEGDVYAWSLAALLEQLPYELCDDDGNSSYLEINKEDDVYQLVYADPYGNFESIETDRHEHFVDACVAMIESLHELNLL